MEANTESKELLYLRIAKTLEKQIATDVLKVGDKLPSIRMISRQQGVSIGTAQQAFFELEKKALIESRPQSGYYVSSCPRKRMEIPSISSPLSRSFTSGHKDIFDILTDSRNESDVIYFSKGTPVPDLLPIAKLNKELTAAMRSLQGSGTSYECVEGNPNLRRQIARWSINWKGNLIDSDIITTHGCINAIALCMMAVTQRGDTIALESPCFYGTLQLAQSLGLKIIELPTSPVTGVDLDALEAVLKAGKVKLCLFVSNFANPLGSMMPDDHKHDAVRLLERFNVPLIEDDLYGDIYFGESRPTCCKTYDESGIVMLCNSYSKTVAPGYRVGWMAPGKFKDQVSRLKMYHTMFSTTITHEVMAGFLQNGRYEAHLRTLRQTTYKNYLQFVRVIAEHFPEGTRISRPQGGLSLWAELPGSVNTLDLYEKALRQKVAISPGQFFTLQDQFHNCMRLSYGMVWNQKTENALKLVGRLAGG